MNLFFAKYTVMPSARFRSGFKAGLITAIFLFGALDSLAWVAEEATRFNKKIINLLRGEDDDEGMFDERETPENEPKQTRVKTDCPDYIN